MSHSRSVYLADEEYEALMEMAREKRASPNAVVRFALRRLFGLPVPDWTQELDNEESHA